MPWNLLARIFGRGAAETARIDRELAAIAQALAGGTLGRGDLGALLDAAESGRWRPASASGLRPGRGPRLDEAQYERCRQLAADAVFKHGRPGPGGSGGFGEREVERGARTWYSDGRSLRSEPIRPDFGA